MILSRGQVVAYAPQALADTTPLYVSGRLYPQTVLELSKLWASYGALYRAQLWVRVVVDKRAKAAARLPVVVTREDDSGRAMSVDRSDPLAALLARPNERMSGFRLWLWTSSTLDVYGSALWAKLRVGGQVRELWPMHPANTVVQREPDGTTTYHYVSGSRNAPTPLVFGSDDVVHFREYDPDTTDLGVSRLESLRQTLLNEDAARRATASMWQRGARPGIMLSTPNTLSDAAARRLGAQFDDQHSGADNWGKTAILEEGLEPKLVQLSAEEMQYIESRKLNREEVCAAYDVPPPVVHILDRATFSNITEQMRSMYRDTMTNHLSLIEAEVAAQLIPDFDPSGATAMMFDLNDVVRGDFETRSTAVVSLVSNGVMTPAEGREVMNLPPLVGDSGDASGRLYANQALAPLAALPVGHGPAEPAAPEPKAVSTVWTKGQLVRKAGDRAHIANEHRRALRPLIEAQRDRTVAALAARGHKDAAGTGVDDVWSDSDLSDDDEAMAEVLQPISTAAVSTAGKRVARKMGGTFDPEEAAAWVEAGSAAAASGINGRTRADVAGALGQVDPLAAVKAVFAVVLGSRLDQIATTRATNLDNFGEHEGARQSGAATKTWVVQSSNPRASHAALEGSSVGIDDVFGNGCRWPGDSGGSADETAGCTCALTFESGGSDA